MKGYIYFLSNPAMPSIIKIGHTTQEVEVRVRQLNSTGVPTPFILEACFNATDSMKAEQAIHQRLNSRRYTNDREFFTGSVKEILSECFDIILKYSASETMVSNVFGCLDKYNIDNESINLLLCLCGYKRHNGYTVCELLGNIKESPLKTEVRLANLKELKLVTEKRSRGDFCISTWYLTSKGKKYLFDGGHLTENILESRV